MMDQRKWEILDEAFQKDEKFSEEGYANDYDFENIDLMDWLECDSRGPSWDMIDEFLDNGYSVFAIEKDSFGWLIGGVQKKEGSERIITFG